MRKAILRYLTIASVAVASALASGSCTGDDIDAPGQQDDGFAINFYCSESNTRADGDPENAVSDYNENKIVSLAVALYPTSYGNDQNAVKFKVFKNLSSDISYTGKISLKEDEIASLFGNPAVSGTTCKVYAVANLPETTLTGLEGTKPTITALKNISITSEFNTKQTQSSFIMNGQGTAAYTSNAGSISIKGEVPLYRTAAKITLNVKLPDKVHDPDDENVYWWPLPERGMQVLLNNGVKNSKVVSDGTVGSDGDYFNITTANENNWNFSDNSSAEYRWKQSYPFYTYPNKWENTPSETHRTSLTLIIPWQKGNASMVEGSTYETFYYTVPVTDTDLTEITSNYSYHIDLSVNMIGSRSPEYPEEIVGTYKAVDWMKEEMNVDVKDSRYLIVTPKVYEINNIEEFSIPFYSSHDVMIEDITMTYSRFNTVSNGNGDVVNIDIKKDVIDKSVSNGDSLCNYYITYNNNLRQYNLNIKHGLKIWNPINNNGNIIATQATGNEGGIADPGYADAETAKTAIEKAEKYEKSDIDAYSQYTITVTIRHKDNKNYKETVIFNQYPAMYIMAEKNTGGVYRCTNDVRPYGIFGNPNIDDDVDYGYVFVNPIYHPANGRNEAYWENSHRGTNDRTNGLGGVPGLGGSNENPNMYIITVSKLNSATQNFYIGDPRSLFVNNNLTTIDGNNTDPENSWSNPGEALYPIGSTEKRRLTYYYPTNEGSVDIHKMMIAPKFRIASSYGKSNPTYLTRKKARRRCATYQEQGYPAGRWRIPTYGEIKYITNLSSLGRIPKLLTVGATYWSAQGAITVNNDGTLTLLETDPETNVSVRCVYDEWYWEKEPDYQLKKKGDGSYVYTYGDMPKRNSQQ